MSKRNRRNRNQSNERPSEERVELPMDGEVDVIEEEEDVEVGVSVYGFPEEEELEDVRDLEGDIIHTEDVVDSVHVEDEESGSVVEEEVQEAGEGETVEVEEVAFTVDQRALQILNRL